MRLDKFLKLYKIIKRRTMAHDVCGEGFVHVNGRSAKAGKELHENDVVTVNYAEDQKATVVRILKLRDGNVVSPDDIEITEESLAKK